MSSRSTQIVLVRRPEGLPVVEDFEVREVEVGEPGDGEVVVATEFVSLDEEAVYE